jgi:hypothetical protein
MKTYHVLAGKVAARERRPDHRAIPILLEQWSVFNLELLAVEQTVWMYGKSAPGANLLRHEERKKKPTCTGVAPQWAQ